MDYVEVDITDLDAFPRDYLPLPGRHLVGDLGLTEPYASRRSAQH